MASVNASQSGGTDNASNQSWTYPTRFCRICREDVPPTVTMYPPGLPIAFQRPIVEYKNEDEYGRLIRPCLCRGGMRYIHEHCLLRSRTENNRVGSMWKCHECGHKFNFQKLAIQRFLGSKYSSGVLTIMVMLIIMFGLGFVADPIINLYADPYDIVMGREEIWIENRLQATANIKGFRWLQHFLKGFVSMGLVGLMKTVLLNPFHWWNLRQSARSTTTGRDRTINLSWVMILLGVISAFYFFYKWVQTIIQKSLQRVGNNIVDTQLPGDDDDIKPPPGWMDAESHAPETQSDSAPTDTSENATATEAEALSTDQQGSTSLSNAAESKAGLSQRTSANQPDSSDEILGSWPTNDDSAFVGRNTALQDAISQDWTFADL